MPAADPSPAPSSSLAARAALVALVLLGVLATLVVVRLGAPDVVPRDAPPEAFSAARARVHVEQIARVPHPSGSAAAREVESYIAGVLDALGLNVERHAGPACTEAAGLRRCGQVRNVVGTLPGRVRDGAILLSAHYDSVPNAPGAGDDGAAVAALLETARALSQAAPLERDVLFAFLDGEEDLLLGSAQLCPAAGLRSRVRLVGNFDARGSRGAVTLISASSGSAADIAELASAVPHPVLSSFYPSVARVLPNATDAEVYDRCGLRTLSFAFAAGFEHYHQASDTPAHLDDRSVQHHGSYALALARRFAGAEPPPPDRDGGLVFFDVGALVVVRYPDAVARLFALALVIATFVVLRRRLRAGVSAARLALASAGFAASAVAAVALGALVIHAVTLGWRVWSAYIHAPALAACAACFVVAAYVALAALLSRRWPPELLALGPLVVWVGLTALSAALVPGMSHVFTWPGAALLASVALAPRAGLSGLAWRYLLLVPAVLLITPVIYTLLVVMGAPGAAAAMGCVVLSLGAGAEPVLVLATRARRVAPALLVLGILGGAVLAARVRREPGPAAQNTIAYAVDRDRALWLSADASNDTWKQQFLGPHPEAELVPAFGSDRALLASRAPLLELEPPTLELVSDAWTGDERTLVLRVRTPRAARSVLVWEDTRASFSRLRFDGAEPIPIIRFSPELDRKLLRLLTGLGDEGRWSVTLFAPEARGSLLEVTTREAGPLEFRIADRSEGLAAVPASYVARPPEWSEGYPGDHTLVSGAPLRVLGLERPVP